LPPALDFAGGAGTRANAGVETSLDACTLKRAPLSFRGADALSARGSQPRSSDLAELSRSRAERPAQAKGPPHKQMPESGKTKWHCAEACATGISITGTLEACSNRPRSRQPPY
jgi:hypothetical protein